MSETEKSVEQVAKEAMPLKFKEFINGLTYEEADELYMFIDGDPHAPGGILDYILDVHPTLADEPMQDKPIKEIHDTMTV